MKKVAIYASLLLLGFSAVAQNTDKRKLDKFTTISVSEGIDVRLIKGSTYEAEITARNIDLDEILTEVSGGHLKVHLEGNNHNNVNVSIDVTFVSLEGIYASSAADIKSSSVIEASNLKIKASSAADIDLEIKVSTLDVSASSAADVVLSGTADSQDVDISSASDYKAFDLKSKVADVSASSAADARVTVSESLDAHASSGASIKYKGSPDKLRERSSSGGDVREY